MVNYEYLIKCIDDLLTFVEETENASTGTSFTMYDKKRKLMMHADLAEWEEGMKSLKEYLRYVEVTD